MLDQALISRSFTNCDEAEGPVERTPVANKDPRPQGDGVLVLNIAARLFTLVAFPVRQLGLSQQAGAPINSSLAPYASTKNDRLESIRPASIAARARAIPRS